MMQQIKSFVGFFAILFMLAFSAFTCWDYVHTKLEDHERRLAELEMETRPLIIVDKFSDVYLNGEEVKKHDGRKPKEGL